MKLHELFVKPVDREIEGVIKADDLEKLKIEIEEYVITNEISKALGNFFEAYNEGSDSIGVWISGFFGSGKSHLLKMLSFLLENQVVEGQSTLDYFIPKCEDDAFLKASMEKATTIPSKSILFNIDQKADTISKTDIDAVLAVFVKVFNEMQGYYGKHGYVGEFERHLDRKGLLDEFKVAFKEVSGHEWSFGREQIILEKENISEAYAKVADVSRSSTDNIIDEYREDYKLSIEDFAKQVNDYIQKKEKGFRLNFFVDEVGQYIADNIKLMTNLQTIAESLGTKCDGRAWIFVTAQEDMEQVIGDMERQGNDFSKIQDRFGTRLKLTSANVDEVIQKRLLQKNEEGEEISRDLYSDQKNNFGTLFNFSDDSVSFKNYRDEKHFVLTYPFVPYQFTLFQNAIESLSLHNAFEGKHSSVGERSMLGVFQDVVLEIASKEPGELATFDLMFKGIRSALKSQVTKSITFSESQLDSAFAQQVLKALFLVKYVKGFKTTPRNLRVLLQEKFDRDLPALRNDVEVALDLLEQQTYIQRNGDVYEYLTDEEKDVEAEIKNTEVDSDPVLKILDDILFTEILKDRKVRYGETNQDYSFTKKIDDRQIGREHELSIHFVTPFSENADSPQTLQAHSLGKPELVVLLPMDDRFLRDILLHQKTEKYIRLHHSTAQQDTIRRILGDKRLQNNDRFKLIQDKARELVGKSRIFISGEEIEISGNDPQSRVIKGFNELITRVYPNLRMLRGGPYREEDIERYLKISQEASLFGDAEATFSEAEHEILAVIRGDNRNGLRSTMKGLVDKFSTRPYGWYLAGIQCNFAKLIGRMKVEARSDANVLEDDILVFALKNTHGFGNVVLTPLTEPPPENVKKLKNFFSDYFNGPPHATEPRALGKETREAFHQTLDELERLIASSTQYPFLNNLEKIIRDIESLGDKSYDFFLEDFLQDTDEYMKDKDEVIDPIRRFMSGSNKTIFNESTEFCRKQEPNFYYMRSEEPRILRGMLESPGIYQGDQMREVKQKTQAIKKEITGILEIEKKSALARLDELHGRLSALEEYQSLPAEKKKEAGQPFSDVKNEIETKTLIAVIRESVARFEQEKYLEVLGKVAAWTSPDIEDDELVQIEFITRDELGVKFAKPFLATEEDVEAYVSSLKAAMLKAIKQNKHIQI